MGDENQNLNDGRKAPGMGRPPSAKQLVTAIDKNGIDSKTLKSLTGRMTYLQIGAIRSHPKFQQLLDGIVIAALLEGKELDNSQRWVLKFLKEDAAAAAKRKAPDELNKSAFTKDSTSNDTPIDVTPEPE